MTMQYNVPEPGSAYGLDITLMDMELDDYSSLPPSDNSSMEIFNHNDTNLTTTQNVGMPMPEISPILTVMKATVMFAIIFSAILGNILVILSVFTFRNLQIIANSFIVSLAFADLLVAILVMPFSALQNIAGRWMFSQVMCDVFNANDVLFSTASLVHLCCISMDRYIAITDPFHYEAKMTKKRVALMLCLAWGVSAMISHIPVHTGLYADPEFRYIIYPYEDDPKIGICVFVVNKIYAIISSCLSFWIPTFIMVFTYAMVFKEARRQEKNIMKMTYVGRSSMPINSNGRDSVSNGSAMNGFDNQASEPRRLSKERNKIRREHKAAKTLGIIMSAFLVCWLPFFLWYVITTVCGEERCPTPEIVISILFWVGYFNSALNPMIYAFYNKEFRRAFIILLKCQRIRRFCTNNCCEFCVRRGWIRRHSDRDSAYLAGLPPRSSRPSMTPSAGFNNRNNSFYNNGSGFRGINYDTVPEKEET